MPTNNSTPPPYAWIKVPRVIRPTYQALVPIQGTWTLSGFVLPHDRLAVYLSVALGFAVAILAKKLSVVRGPTAVVFGINIITQAPNISRGGLPSLAGQHFATDKLYIGLALCVCYLLHEAAAFVMNKTELARKPTAPGQAKHKR